MLRKWTVVSAATLALLVTVGCRPSAGGGGSTASGTLDEARSHASPLTVTLDGPETFVVGPATLDLSIVAGDVAVEGADVTVTGDMTHAGMVPVVARATFVRPGTYRTEGFAFTMAGDWILTIEVSLDDGTASTHEVAVRARRP